MTSRNGRYALKVQADGNIVLQKGSDVLWASGTYGKGNGPYVMKMQEGNHLVLYDTNNKVIWDPDVYTGKDGHQWKKGGFAEIQDDGNFVVYDGNRKGMWATKTYGGKKGSENGKINKIPYKGTHFIKTQQYSNAALKWHKKLYVIFYFTLFYNKLYTSNIAPQGKGWNVKLHGSTKLSGTWITGGTNDATIAYHVNGNVFIIAAVRGPYLKMVKIAVTGETTFDWIDAKYHKPSATSSCRYQDTFSESCFHGKSVSKGQYNVQLVASSGSGK